MVNFLIGLAVGAVLTFLVMYFLRPAMLKDKITGEVSQIKEPSVMIGALQNAPVDDTILVNEWGPWVQVNDRADLIAALIAAFPQ